MAQVIALPSAHAASDDYVVARMRLVDVLLRHALLASYDSFAEVRKPYPFADPNALLPSLAGHGVEHSLQNTALVFLLDRTLPRRLANHFRLRGSNRVSWANIKRIAPDLDLSDYKAQHCQVSDAAFDALLLKLAPLDYALMLERPQPEDGEVRPCQLTHMHVKVERLTDNAIKQTARRLGYIERRLFERGEDYVDALETKFFEYYGFPPNASGRKSAAAMAAQLFAEEGLRFTVFVASQEDCRLTVLDETDRITQYMLVKPNAAARAKLARAAEALGGLPHFVARSERNMPVMMLRVVFHRTAAAMPRQPGAKRGDDELQAPWLEIEEVVIVPPESGRVVLGYP
jgi:hypothetical protein